MQEPMDSSIDNEAQQPESQGEVSQEIAPAASASDRSALIDFAALVIVLAGLAVDSGVGPTFTVHASTAFWAGIVVCATA